MGVFKARPHLSLSVDQAVAPDLPVLQEVLHHVNGAPSDWHHGDWRCLHDASN